MDGGISKDHLVQRPRDGVLLRAMDRSVEAFRLHINDFLGVQLGQRRVSQKGHQRLK